MCKLLRWLNHESDRIKSAYRMGLHNSSSTRVVPVFDRLFVLDATGQAWLQYLLCVGSRSALTRLPTVHPRLIPHHPRTWGRAERRLSPPRSLLAWLAHNISEVQVNAPSGAEPTHSRRLALARKDSSVLSEAIAGINSGNWKGKWYALEGDSSPDAFLETDQLVLVIEGKRTEKSCTTKTKWMSRRSQLLRHMDAAFEIAGSRQVLGLLIVEGADPAPLQPSPFWLKQVDIQVSSNMLDRSLPHRADAERDRKSVV